MQVSPWKLFYVIHLIIKGLLKTLRRNYTLENVYL